ALLNFEWAIHAVAFMATGVELHLVIVAFVVYLAEDQFQQFPESLWLLETLIASDIVVAAAKREQQGVRCGGFELIKPGAILGLVLHAELWNVRYFLKFHVPLAVHSTV